MPALSVIIVNWNGGETLRRCLATIPAKDGDVDVEVIVVDNDSTDGSAAELACAAPLKVLRNATNVGFGRACNAGAHVATASRLLFLNPDVELAPGVLAISCAALVDDVAVVGVRLDDDGGPARTCARRARPWLFWRVILGLDAVGVGGESLILPADEHIGARDVEHVMGAFYLVDRDVFFDVGGFDERFFVFLEDLDLSQRIRDAGRRIRFLGDTGVFHAGGASTRSHAGLRLALALESRIRFAFKHFTAAQAVGLAVGTFAVEPLLRLARAASGHGPDTVVGVVRGTAGALRRLVRL